MDPQRTEQNQAILDLLSCTQWVFDQFSVVTSLMIAYSFLETPFKGQKRNPDMDLGDEVNAPWTPGRKPIVGQVETSLLEIVGSTILKEIVGNIIGAKSGEVLSIWNTFNSRPADSLLMAWKTKPAAKLFIF